MIKAIFKSLWVFSMTFAASAILILSTLYMPAFIIDEYNFETFESAFLFDPETTLTISVNFLFLSPGLILSGEYPR